LAFRGGRHAVNAKLLQTPGDHKPTETGFVADAQCAALVSPDAPQELLTRLAPADSGFALPGGSLSRRILAARFQGVEVVCDDPRLSDLPEALRFSHGGGDRLTRSLRSSRPCGAAFGSLPHLPAANRGFLWTSSPM